MKSNQGISISKKGYRWLLKFLDIAHKRLHLNIKVHNDKQILEDGQIFLFNHFARFETIIPPYIIYKETRAYSLIIADHNLFNINDKMTNFFTKMGVVPSNMPGLLPFLAAEILRGQKVVIFPEGNMVKDRRVLDEDGKVGIFSFKKNMYKKHHRGAAALAFTLDIFKRRIKGLFAEGDLERIGHWCQALGIEDPDNLLEQANKPTFVVPSTITFFPIRMNENILSKALNFFSKKTSDRIIEELIIEGNLLLYDTDMDICLGKPLEVKRQWPWWQKMLLKQYFLSIDSLNDLFSIREHADRWHEKLLVQGIAKETDRIRDAYMNSLYEGTMINQGHLTSTLITVLIDNNIEAYPKEKFHKILYVAFKKLQQKKGIYFHRSLSWPDRCRGLLEGTNKELQKFFDNCEALKLIQQKKDVYKFLNKLKKDHLYHEVRLENPVAVYTNECAPIQEVKDTLEEVFHGESNWTDLDISTYLFDDEMRAYHWNKEHYSQDKFQKINEKETATEDGAPYLLLPKKKAKVGVLLVHGFLASPAELKVFGGQLHKEGFAVMGVRLAGHGTSPWDLHHRYEHEWLNSVQRSYKILAAHVDKVVVVGFSTGAVISLSFVTEKPKKLAGIVSVSAAWGVTDYKTAFVPWMTKLNKLSHTLLGNEGVIPFYMSKSERPLVNYCQMPVHAINELLKVVNALKKIVSGVTAPLLILQGDKDPVVDPKGGKAIYEAVSSVDKKYVSIKSDRHGIIADDIGGTCDVIMKFIKKINKKVK